MIKIKILVLVSSLVLFVNIQKTTQAFEKDILRQELKADLVQEQFRENISLQRTDELKTWDYQIGKSMIDMEGNRVRIEKYVTRPNSKEIDFYVLNSHSNGRLNCFYSKSIFNEGLPSDLRPVMALVWEKTWTSQPDYVLGSYEEKWSNSSDTVLFKKENGQLKVNTQGKFYVDYDPITVTVNGVTEIKITKAVTGTPLSSPYLKWYTPVPSLEEGNISPTSSVTDVVADLPANLTTETETVKKEVIVYGDMDVVSKEKDSNYEIELTNKNLQTGNIDIISTDKFSELNTFLLEFK